jgi:type I restriction enzyme R subunit
MVAKRTAGSGCEGGEPILKHPNVLIAGRTLSANQIEFIDLIINHLTEHGVMGAALLYESPFTDIAPRGPDDLFTSEDVDRLVAVLDHVRTTAQAA